jgi:hypothetical protein
MSRRRRDRAVLAAWSCKELLCLHFIIPHGFSIFLLKFFFSNHAIARKYLRAGEFWSLESIICALPEESDCPYNHKRISFVFTGWRSIFGKWSGVILADISFMVVGD